MPTPDGASIQTQLEPLFARARAEGLWFYSAYQDLWFSPDELAAVQAAGRFRWGAVNWQLRKPDEYLADKAAAVKQAEANFNAAVRRVTNG